MDIRFWYFSADALTISVLLMVLVFSVGIVWRVEKKLDLSYKFLVLAICALAFGEVLNLYYNTEQSLLWVIIGKLLRLVGATFFLVSVLLMRDIVRVLDHEKPGSLKGK